MQNAIYVRTVGLDFSNYVGITKDIKEWVKAKEVFVQNKPVRLIVLYEGYATVINEGDVFSFIEDALSGKHLIVNHSEKRNTLKVSIDGYDFIIEAQPNKFVIDPDCGFRVTCVSDLEFTKSVASFKDLLSYLSDFLRMSLENNTLN